MAVWAFLEEGVDHILKKLQTGVSYSKVTLFSRSVLVAKTSLYGQYMSLYTVAYNYCTSSKINNANSDALSNRSEFQPDDVSDYSRLTVLFQSWS